MNTATSLSPPSTSVSGIQFSILNVLEPLIPKEKKKQQKTKNKTKKTQHLDEVGATIYGCHTTPLL